MKAFPFGRHKGKALGDIPGAYLAWVLSNVEALYPDTRQAIEAEIQRREQAKTAPVNKPAPKPAPTEATCSICGLPPSQARPLVQVHQQCVEDRSEVAF